MRTLTRPAHTYSFYIFTSFFLLCALTPEIPLDILKRLVQTLVKFAIADATSISPTYIVSQLITIRKRDATKYS